MAFCVAFPNLMFIGSLISCRGKRFHVRHPWPIRSGSEPPLEASAAIEFYSESLRWLPTASLLAQRLCQRRIQIQIVPNQGT